MAQAQITLTCNCGLKPKRNLILERVSGPTVLKCNNWENPCDFGLLMQIVRMSSTFPQYMTYSVQEKKNNVWNDTVVYDSFRGPELGWLEYKSVLCRMSPERSLQQYIDNCESTRRFFTSFQTRMLVSIARNNHDAQVIKMLLGNEALHLGKLCEKAASECCKGCSTLGGDNQHLWCTLGQDTKIRVCSSHWKGVPQLPSSGFQQSEC